jgi:RNA ligase (TIGR02306 family)
MSDWNPQVCQIEKIEQHTNADTLCIYTVLNDYPVLDKIGKYNINDLVSYIPIDSIVPDTEEFYFLCPNATEQYLENDEVKLRILGPKFKQGEVPEKYRVIKAKKIRQIYSQGLLLPAPTGFSLGDNITEHFSLTKVEEENEDNLPTLKTKGRNAASPPKGWTIPYYDIDGLRKYVNCLKEDEEVVLLEKINGSNASFCFDGEALWVKSRNFFKKPDPTDPWWNVAGYYDLQTKLSKYPMMVFWGELYGLVKGFRYDAQIENGMLQPKVAFFDVYDPKAQKFLDYDNSVSLIKEVGLTPVPELYRGKWLGKDQMYPYAEGLTTLGGKHTREGFVLKTIKERFEPRLNSRMQIKLVGEGYNLKK